MSEINPSARPFELCQRLHGVLVAYLVGDDIPAAQAGLFGLFAEEGDPSAWTWAVWPNYEAREAVIALYGTWSSDSPPMTAETWASFVGSDDIDHITLLYRAFAVSGDPSEWPDFRDTSPDLKRYLSEKFTAFLAEQPR